MFFESPCKAKGIERLFLSVVKEKMRDLSSNQINFERERDPVGEKVHQNRSGGLRPPPFVGSYFAVAAVWAAAFFTDVLTDVFTGVFTDVFTDVFPDVVAGAFTGAFTDVFTGVFTDVFTGVFTDVFTDVFKYVIKLWCKVVITRRSWHLRSSYFACNEIHTRAINLHH